MSKQFNARLPQLCHDQINALVRDYGLTKTQVVILAVDRFARELQAGTEDAQKDVKRLKVVARIAPHLDVGQDG